MHTAVVQDCTMHCNACLEAYMRHITVCAWMPKLALHSTASASCSESNISVVACPALCSASSGIRTFCMSQ